MAESFLDQVRANHRWVMAFGVGLVVAALLVGHQAYAQVSTERIVHERPLWKEHAAYEYSLPVTRNATLWPVGTDHGMGQPVYYRSVSEFMHVNFSWQAEGAEDVGFVQVDMVMRLRGQDRQGSVYWEVERPLASALGRPSEGVSVAGTIDLDRTHAEMMQLVKELPLGDGSVNWTVEAKVAYAVRGGGKDSTAVTTYMLPIRSNDPRIHLPTKEQLTWRPVHSETVTATMARPSGWAGALGTLATPAFAVLGVALLAGGAWAHHSDPGRGLPARQAAFARERSRFEEWVTIARRPVPTQGSIVDVGSLEDLVRVAADGRARVLLHEPTRTCYVVLATMTYRYAAA